MEILLNEEFRLIYFLILQAAILVAAWRFVSRRIATDWADRAADVLLLTFLVQYLCVTLPGLTGLLNPLSIAITTIAISAALFFAPFKTAPPPVPARLSQSQPDKGFATTPFNWSLLTCALFAIGYLAFMAWNQRFMPITANDAITYHFPAAVHWLQTGRLSLFETWFFNPANTYSPLAGSTFIAWWIAPPGNDVLARHVQAPALLLIFFAAVRLMRALGVRSAIAALIALALLLSKPFLRQSQIEKDDLYLAAFFACAAAGFAQERLRDPLGPWRIGVALGLLLAVKVSALLSLPVLLLVIDAPFRARWPARRYAIVVALVLLLAGPWYLRNLLLTGNPLFPAHLTFFGITLFKGIITTAPSAQFASLRSIWLLLTARDQSLPLLPMIALLLGAIAVWAGRIRMLRSDPLARLCLLGPPLALLVFLKTSPFPEARYLTPPSFSSSPARPLRSSPGFVRRRYNSWPRQLY